MTVPGFLKGMAIGLAAGVVMDMAVQSKAMRKTDLGKTMQKVSGAMDDMISDVSRAIR